MRKWAKVWLGGVGAWLLGSAAWAHPVIGSVTDSPLSAAANFSAMARQLNSQPLPFSRAILMADTGMAWRLDLGASDPLSAETTPALYGPSLEVQIELAPRLGADDEAMLSSRDLQGNASVMGLTPLSFDLATDLSVAHLGPATEITDQALHDSLNPDGTPKFPSMLRRTPASFDEQSARPPSAELDPDRLEAEARALRNEMLPWVLGIALIYAAVWAGRTYVRVTTRRRWVAPRKKRRGSRRRSRTRVRPETDLDRRDDDFSMATTVPMTMTLGEEGPSLASGSRLVSTDTSDHGGSSSGSRRRSHRRRL